MAPSPVPADAPAFTILYQRESTQTTGGGQFVPGMQIGFTTPSGVQASIFVPYTSYQPDTVRQLIIERVRQIESIHQLGQG